MDDLFQIQGSLVHPLEQLVKDTWSPLRARFPQGGDFSLKELLRVTVQESDNNKMCIRDRLSAGVNVIAEGLPAQKLVMRSPVGNVGKHVGACSVRRV